MRPTDLRYRSPKEKTAEYLLPKITNNGNLLLEIVRTKKHPSLSQGRRFKNYDEEAKKTGFRVGPGSYEQNHLSLAKRNIRGGHVYKNYHRKSDMSNNGYIFIGDQIMFDATFMIPSFKNNRQDVTHTSDITDMNLGFHNKASRSTSSNTPVRRVKNRPNVMSPNYEEFNNTRASR
jgi:hypothetical protein